ncbi:MAG: hypothetical protein AB1489_29325 [Acidobacteriota bacterium]
MSKVEVARLIIEPIQCHCTRCHGDWETRDKTGKGHKIPPRCAKLNCNTPYWRDLPIVCFRENFDPFKSTTPMGRLVFQKADKTICEKCFFRWAKEAGIPEGEAKRMLENHKIHTHEKNGDSVNK